MSLLLLSPLSSQPLSCGVGCEGGTIVITCYCCARCGGELRQTDSSVFVAARGGGGCSCACLAVGETEMENVCLMVGAGYKRRVGVWNMSPIADTHALLPRGKFSRGNLSQFTWRCCYNARREVEILVCAERLLGIIVSIRISAPVLGGVLSGQKTWRWRYVHEPKRPNYIHF